MVFECNKTWGNYDTQMEAKSVITLFKLDQNWITVILNKEGNVISREC